MAARNRVGLAENTRKRIQTSMIINRLTDHIDGKCELSATQVRAAEVLLNRTLPVLQSIEYTSDTPLLNNDKTFTIQIVHNNKEQALGSVIEGETVQDKLTAVQ